MDKILKSIVPVLDRPEVGAETLSVTVLFVLIQFGFHTECSMGNCHESFFLDQISGYASNFIGLFLIAHMFIIQCINKLF